MYNAGKILPGLILFLALVTSPIWVEVGAGPEAPYQRSRSRERHRCVADTEYMRREHMQLLTGGVTRWSDRESVYVAADGRHYEKSLTGTCLGCHESKAKACDRCHAYLAVTPYCWECHVDPKGGR